MKNLILGVKNHPINMVSWAQLSTNCVEANPYDKGTGTQRLTLDIKLPTLSSPVLVASDDGGGEVGLLPGGVQEGARVPPHPPLLHLHRQDEGAGQGRLVDADCHDDARHRCRSCLRDFPHNSQPQRWILFFVNKLHLLVSFHY